MNRRVRLADLGLLPLLLFVVALNVPYFAAHVVPVHDTFYNFSNFQIFYSEFFLRGDLVQWYPYGAYGLPADFQQLISLTPIDYLVGLVGALLRVRDAMQLFKVSAVAEQMVFVLGTWLLARRLFKARATALALGIASAGTVVWYAQQWFDLRFFYLLPLLLYFFASFLELRRPEALWLAGLTAVAWAMGNVPYFVPIWVLVLAIVVAAPAWDQRGAWSSLFQLRAPNLLLFAAFVLSASTYVYLALHSIDFLAMRDLGRNPVTGDVDLETFRTWGGNADLRVVASSLFTGWPLQLPWGSGSDNSFYFGLLPVLGVGVAIARERSRLFFGLVAASVALVWLSVGGIFATIVFYLPGMSQYRHVGLVYGLVKTLLILAAGYGLDRLWTHRLPLPSQRVLRIGAAVLGGASLFVVPRLLAGFGGSSWAADATDHVLLRIWLYAVLFVISLALTRSMKPGLLLALALDLAIYQAAVYELRAPKLSPEYAAKLDAFEVDVLQYQPERHARPEDASPQGAYEIRQRRALDLAKHPSSMEVYWVTYGVAHFDPCRSQFWNELSTYGVDLVGRMERRLGPDFDAIIGCGSPKLRVVTGATVVSDAGAAREAFKRPVPGGSVRNDVIRLAAGVQPPVDTGPPSPHAGRAEVTAFTPNELVAKLQIDAPGGAWLLYADAMYPGWHASVDGRVVPIAEANLAFKAIWVPAGASVIRFWFQRGLSYYASWGIAVFGVACALGLIALLFVEPRRRTDST